MSTAVLVATSVPSLKRLQIYENKSRKFITQLKKNQRQRIIGTYYPPIIENNKRKLYLTIVDSQQLGHSSETHKSWKTRATRVKISEKIKYMRLVKP